MEVPPAENKQPQNRPTVTIGMPVYNGLPYVREALAAIAAQDYPNLEILISDNCSADGTPDVCREMLAGRSGVRYWRNPRNIGPLPNFLLVLERARGKYFMWAAHDDRWSPQFVSSLVARLEAEPDAVLATPAAVLNNQDGSLHRPRADRPALAATNLENLRILYDDHATSWFYGVYRTDWLRRHHNELTDYPVWGGDVIWLADLCMRFKFVGSEQAIIYKRLRKSRLAPNNARAQIAFWAYMFWFLGRSAFATGRSSREQWTALRMACGYVYRMYIRRPNPVRTAWRIVRMLGIAAVTALPAGLWQLGTTLTRRMQGAPPPTDQKVDLHEIIAEIESLERQSLKAA
jgi:glycosyltransferase involved in cell wall biosynthesis